ncbi:MAG: universal stress protein [Thermomicrobiales bacterium]
MRLLIAIDLSPESSEAVRFAGVLHALLPGTATLLAVVHHEQERSQGREMLASIGSAVPDLGDAQQRVRVGKTADEIVAEAGNGEHDLVILGQRGQSRLAQMLIGNTAIQVMAGSPVPVIVVHDSRSALRHLLVCTSGSDYARSNVEQASRIAARAGADLRILHVMSQIDVTPSSPAPGLDKPASWHVANGTPEGEHLAGLCRIAEEHGVHAEPVIRYGLVVDEIFAEARSNDYDLVVVGAHHRHGLAGFLLDDVTKTVISHLRRPVLIVR